MIDFEYITAKDFDRAWLNFELDLPLQPGKDGKVNPFYINRPGNPIAELEDALLSPFYQPPKFFFSGHRGCGKSTELLHLMSNPDIQSKFWTINFSIRDEADIIDLDFRDILLSIGGRMFREYKKNGGKLPEQLVKELNTWRGKLEEEIKTIKGMPVALELEGGIEAFFVQTGLKMKMEPKTRKEIRQVFERDITGLISVINNIAMAIYGKEKRIPLILIDDLDKPELQKAREIFHDHREIMMQPNCAIVYTVSSALFYNKNFDSIRDRAIFLPNIELHPRLKPNVNNEKGYQTMKNFICQRMAVELIESTAMTQAITYSGGVFRELARIMRTAIGQARRRKTSRIEMEDVEYAATEMRNEYRRILEKEDIAILKKVQETNQLEYSERLTPLLQLLAMLEYRNGENWCDVHPVLRKILNNNGSL